MTRKELLELVEALEDILLTLEESLTNVTLHPLQGEIRVDIQEDYLNYLVSQIDREDQNSLTAQADEENDHIGVQ